MPLPLSLPPSLPLVRISFVCREPTLPTFVDAATAGRLFHPICHSALSCQPFDAAADPSSFSSSDIPPVVVPFLDRSVGVAPPKPPPFPEELSGPATVMATVGPAAVSVCDPYAGVVYAQAVLPIGVRRRKAWPVPMLVQVSSTENCCFSSDVRFLRTRFSGEPPPSCCFV